MVKVLRRSKEIESSLLKRAQKPFVVKNFLSQVELDSLLQDARRELEDLSKQWSDLWVSRPNANERSGLIQDELLKRIKVLCPEDVDLAGCGFIRLMKPVGPHTDSGTRPEVTPCMGAHLLLESNPLKETKQIVFFHQRHSGTKTNFLRGCKDTGSQTDYLNLHTPYAHLKGYTAKPFDPEFHHLHLSHIPVESLEGLSVETMIDVEIGDLLLFNADHIHCSTNWPEKGEGKASKTFLFFQLDQAGRAGQ